MPHAGTSHRGARYRAVHLSYRQCEFLCAAVADAALHIARLCRVGMTGRANWSWPVLRNATEFGRTRESVCGRNVRLLLTMPLLSGCSGPQSTLDPAGPSAASIHFLGIIMYAGAAAVTLLVVVLMLAPFIRWRDVHVRDQTPVARRASALPGKLVRRLAHDGSTFSAVGVTGKPGAVQLQERRAKLIRGVAVAHR